MTWYENVDPVSEEDERYCKEHWEEYRKRRMLHMEDPINYDSSVLGVFNRLLERMKKEVFDISGGLAFFGNDKSIYPGCCSRFDRWYTIKQSLRDKSSVFMGHDPNVSFGEKDGVCYISTAFIGSYGGTKSQNGKRVRYRVTRTVEEALKDDRATTIGFLPDEWEYCLDKLDRYFKGFVDGPLRKKIKEIIPEREEEFLEAFTQCFMKPQVF